LLKDIDKRLRYIEEKLDYAGRRLKCPGEGTGEKGIMVKTMSKKDCEVFDSQIQSEFEMGEKLFAKAKLFANMRLLRSCK